jgi:hypothetical protein
MLFSLVFHTLFYCRVYRLFETTKYFSRRFPLPVLIIFISYMNIFVNICEGLIPTRTETHKSTKIYLYADAPV